MASSCLQKYEVGGRRETGLLTRSYRIQKKTEKNKMSSSRPFLRFYIYVCVCVLVVVTRPKICRMAVYVRSSIIENPVIPYAAAFTVNDENKIRRLTRGTSRVFVYFTYFV